MLKNSLLQPSFFLSASAPLFSSFFCFSFFLFQRSPLCFFFFLPFFSFQFTCALFSAQKHSFQPKNILFSPKQFSLQPKKNFFSPNVFQFFSAQPFLLQPKTFLSSAHTTVSASFCFVLAFFLFCWFCFQRTFFLPHSLLFQLLSFSVPHSLFLANFQGQKYSLQILHISFI